MRVLRALLASLVGIALVPAGAVAAQAESACAPSLNADAALALARACGGRVELLGLRTETGQAFVNPNGTTTFEEYARPQRVRKADGSWSALDSSLVQNPDGTLSPRASTMDTVFSGGGAGPLIRGRKAGKELSLGWKGELPKPVVSGSSATYPQVLPGVDLVLTATETGFSEVLVVKDAKAARNPALRKLSFGTSVSGLRWQNSEATLRAVDGAGNTVFGGTTPMMWDSSDADSDVHGPGQAARLAPMGVSLTGAQLELAPDQGLLADPGLKYPLYLDPSVVADHWTMINSQFPSQSYWSYDKTDCPPGYTGQCAKVGQIYGGTMDYRSIFDFSNSQWAGKQVLDVVFAIDLLHSAYCSNSTTELRQTGGISSGTNWSNHSGSWGGVIASVSNQDCGDARVKSEFASAALTSAIASSGAVTTWGLKASTETSDSAWKKFDAASARLVVTTNDVPTLATETTVDAKACATGSGRPFVPTQTPTIRNRVHDANPDNLTAVTEWSRIRYDGTYSPKAGRVDATQLHDGEMGLSTPPAGAIDAGDEFVGTGDWDKDGFVDALVRDSDGYLYLIAGVGGGKLGKARYVMGVGWGSGDWTIAGLADWDHDGYLDILGRFSDGTLYVYPGNGLRSAPTRPRAAIGGGWGGFTFFGLADWDRDGNMDIVARDSGGVEWLYPGESTLVMSTQARVQIGAGWGGYTPFGAIDWDRDGKPDVIARDPSTGQLWLYLGSGTRGYYTGSPYRYEIGVGWGGYLAMITPDVNADGNADILALQPGITDWFYYPGSGGHGYGGARWTGASVGLSEGRYAFHTTVTDNVGGWSGWNAWCEFEVDTAAPAQASVAADLYPAGCGSCGSVGRTGRFTFSDPSTDVESYLWGFSSPPGNSVSAAVSYVDWTPSAPGAQTLFVIAVDKAGNKSPERTHQFTVAQPSNALATWVMDETSGTVLRDSLDPVGGPVVNLPVSGATLGVPGRIAPGNDGASQTAVRFNGAGPGATTTGPVLADSSKSFSVAAWLRLDDLSVSRRAVDSFTGSNSALKLKYDQPNNRWKFELPTAAGDTSPGVRSTTAPKQGVWTHVTGVYDSAAQTAKIYLNGVLEGTATGIATWKSTGQTRLGYDWLGSIAQVRLYDRVISQSEVTDLAKPTLVASWEMSNVGYGPDYDSSGFVHDIDFYPQPTGGPQIPPGTSGKIGTGLHLDGVDDYAVTSEPVLHTDQSYTIGVWARLSDKSSDKAVMAQEKVFGYSAFYLMYNQAIDRWTMQVPRSSTDPTWSSASSLSSPPLNTWVHLVAVYNAQNGTLQLWVDGTLQSTVSNVAGWDTPDRLYIGRAGSGYATGNFAGDLDEIRVYQGLPNPATLP